MAQFDVHRNPRAGLYPLLVDVQADLLSSLTTRVVVPLVPRKRYSGKPPTKLTLMATLRGVEYVLVVPELAAIPKSALGEVVGSLAARRGDLVAALDLLLTGS